MNNGITVLIIVINIIITEITISTCSGNRYATTSELYAQMSYYVFIATFFNTAFVIQLANSHKGESIPFIGKIFNGPFNDYSYDWYGNVGN